MEEKVQLCLLFGTQRAGDPCKWRRACLQIPFPVPTDSQISPTLGQLPAPITALPCSKSSHRPLCLNNKLLAWHSRPSKICSLETSGFISHTLF